MVLPGVSAALSIESSRYRSFHVWTSATDQWLLSTASARSSVVALTSRRCLRADVQTMMSRFSGGLSWLLFSCPPRTESPIGADLRVRSGILNRTRLSAHVRELSKRETIVSVLRWVYGPPLALSETDPLQRFCCRDANRMSRGKTL